VGVAARFAAALHDSEPAELAAVSKAFDKLGDRVAAADAMAHAAIVYRLDDLRGSALTCAAQAEALAARCGDVQTPALRQACSPLPLTDREREIVTLLSQDLSNRDIAAKLHVSIRTVEGHIYKAMTKTGTSNRDELAALLKQRPPGD
jgi:DNA-binding CsgD family transcriptional regulator